MNPETLRKRLISASLYIAAYEILKSTVLKRTKYFFMGLNKPGDKGEYKREVRGRDKDLLVASLLWHQEMQAINENDLAAFKRINHCRNTAFKLC